MCEKDNESKLTKEGIFAINTDYYEKLQSVNSDMYFKNKNERKNPTMFWTTPTATVTSRCRRLIRGTPISVATVETSPHSRRKRKH
mgnify:CR=1 FL=1